VVVSLKTRAAAVHPVKGEKQVVLPSYKGSRKTIASVKSLVQAYKPTRRVVAAKRTSQLLRTAKPVKAAKGARRVKAE